MQNFKSITRFLLLVLAVPVFAACSTVAKQDSEPSPAPRGREKMSLEMLERALQMDRSPRDLGYQEKTFDTCQMGFADPKTEACPRRVLVVVQFQLECRDTEGTVSDVDLMEIQPISNARVNWQLGNIQGTAETDREGFGRLITIAPLSQKNERLKLTVNGRFLVQTAEFVRRVVTPKNWCK